MQANKVSMKNKNDDQSHIPCGYTTKQNTLPAMKFYGGLLRKLHEIGWLEYFNIETKFSPAGAYAVLSNLFQKDFHNFVIP